MAALRSPIERLLARIEVSAEPNYFTGSHCWEWQGAKQGAGYGHMSVNGRLDGTHRVTYEFYIGPIPTGMVPDHLCRNIVCCNPDHLEAVTNSENSKRARTSWRIVCKRGHWVLGDNVRIEHLNGRVKRHCRACAKIREGKT